MAEIKIFEKEEFGSIRTVEVDNEIWFVGKDVAEALGYTNPNEAVFEHVQDDDKLDSKTLLSFDYKQLGQRGGWLINESGLYSLILSSKLEKAKEFKHWVTSEVLPEIRRTGSYTIKQPKKSKEEIEATLLIAKKETADLWIKLGERYSDISKYQQVCDAYATKALEGKFVLPLPKQEEKLFTATEIATELGITVQKLGAIANKNNVKNKENGEWIVDVARNGKQVRNFQYNKTGKELLTNLVTIWG